MRIGLLVAAGIAVVIAGLLLLIPRPQGEAAAEVDRPAPPVAREPMTPGRLAVAPPLPEEVQPVGSHPMAVAFGDGAVPPEQEPAVLLELFEVYRREFGVFPAGEDNRQMLHALMGRNPGALPIFPRRHPRLDESGALLDGWGSAFHFHSISRNHLEIRSLGADREIFTDDDIVVPVRPRD